MKKRFTRLTTRVLLVLLITIIPVIGALFAVNHYAVDGVRKEIFSANGDILSVYMEQIDYQLDNIKTFLRGLDAQEIYVAGFQSPNETDGYYAANHYTAEIKNAIVNYPGIQGLMVYTPVTGRQVYAFNTNYGEDFAHREAVMEYIGNEFIDVAANLNTWRFSEAGGHHYLLYAYRVHDTYFCSWSRVDALMLPMTGWKTAQDAALLLMQVGDSWNTASYVPDVAVGALPDPDTELWVLEEPSTTGNFKLVELIEPQSVIYPFTRIYYVAIGILAVFLLCLPLVLGTLNRNVFLPVRRLRGGIAAVRNGNYDSPIPDGGVANAEFRELIGAFNDMTGQVKRYRIQAYEDALEHSRLELQFLQVQVEPHFYLNALNTINAMAQMGDTALIEQLSRNLSDYMRYLASSRMQPVPLGDELRHIRTYIEIQRARLGDQFQLEIQVQLDMQEIKIPPLLVQTLVENSMKYALDVYTQTTVHVEANWKVAGDAAGLEIVVWDNGQGYPPEVVRAMEDGEVALQDNKIGLVNAKKRLEYMFGNTALFKAANRAEGGAETRIWIPVQKGDDT